MNGADPLQLGRLGVVTGTTAPTRLPTGSLVGTSSKGASWITSLTKPFDNYFEIYKTKQQQEFLLKQQAQQGTTSIEKQKMSNRAKAKSDATKRFDVRKLKGPKS